MPFQSYYGGYSLVRSNNATSGSVDANVSKSLATATSTTTSSSISPTAGLAWMNIAALNSDWMPPLSNSSAAERRCPVAPIDAALPSTVGETLAQTSLLRSLFGMQSFYRGAPLRAVTPSVSKATGPCAAKSTAAAMNTTTTTRTEAAAAAETKMATAPVDRAVPERMEAKEKIPCIPKPIGSETWAAITDTALTAKASIVAARHVLMRPVAPKAIDADEVVEQPEAKPLLQEGPTPLFRDLFDLDDMPNTTFMNSSSSAKRLPMPVPVGEPPYLRHLVPPEPILASPMLPVDCKKEKPQLNEQTKQELPQQEQQEMHHQLAQRTESPMSLSEEGRFLSQALLDEVNTGGMPLPDLSIEKPQQNSPLLYGSFGNNGGSLLRESDELYGLFDNDDDEALASLKRVFNFVMSSSTTDVPPKAKKDTEFNMEWSKTTHPNTLFF